MTAGFPEIERRVWGMARNYEAIGNWLLENLEPELYANGLRFRIEPEIGYNMPPEHRLNNPPSQPIKEETD